VFNRGTSRGLEGLMLVGGQIDPISTAGAELEWEKAQEKAKGNITSDVIDKIIP
jgi:hypothetical protein